MELNPSKMPEAEVSVRLAMYLIHAGLAVSDVSVAIDGAQVKTGKNIHFQLKEFMEFSGWKSSSNTWQGTFQKAGFDHSINIHSSAGLGDVVTTLKTGHVLRVESKKGPLTRSKSSQEYPLIREAIGQLLTVEEAGENDILAVAVPYSEKFESLAQQWRVRPLMKKVAVRILTIDRNNQVRGLDGVVI